MSKTPSNMAEASARFVAGDFGTLRAEARVSGPIVRDRVMGSAAILRGVREGFVRDLDHPDHPLGGEDVTAARGKLRVVFNGRTDLLISADVTNQDPASLPMQRCSPSTRDSKSITPRISMKSGRRPLRRGITTNTGRPPA